MALGTTCAEVLSTNCIRVLWNPLGFLPYGLLYVFFLDYLFRKGVSDWKTVYLFGCLVGFITEAYFAKVLFWGWEDGSLLWQGFAVKEFFILIFFFHPVFSFMLPVFIARNFFDFPFNIEKSRHRGLIVWLPLYPAVLFPGTNLDFAADFVVPMSVSLGIVAVFLSLLPVCGRTADILLSRRAKIQLLLFTVAVYVFGFLKAPVYKRDAVRLPETIPLLVSFLMAAGFFCLIYARSQGLKDAAAIRYHPEFNLRRTLVYGIGFYVLTTVLLAVLLPYNTIRTVFLAVFLLAGTVAGVTVFLRILAEALCLRRNLSQSKIRR